MTREEAIKLLKLIKSTVYLGNRKFFDALDFAISYLRQPDQRWISCSERLPEEKGEYLVTYHPCYWDNVDEEIKVGIDTFRGKTTWAKKKYQRVIAWQPLLEPWKDGEADG